MSVSFQCAEGAKLSDLDDYTVTRSGYTFDGWYEGNTKYTADSIMPSRNLNLVAKWSSGTSFSISNYHNTYAIQQISRITVYNENTEIETYWAPTTSTVINCSPGNTIVFYHSDYPGGTRGLWSVTIDTNTSIGYGASCAMTVPSTASGHGILSMSWEDVPREWYQKHTFMIVSSQGWCQSDKLNFRLWSS